MTLQSGHAVDLYQGSRAFFPALVADIDRARSTVRIETYILDFTGATVDVVRAMIRAARRGVQVMLVVDGYGTGPIPEDWAEQFDESGVQSCVYGRLGHLGMLSPRAWRRLHRKLCVVDGTIAYCGGINLLDDFHDPNYGSLTYPRFDFVVRVRGPLVAQVEDTMTQVWQRLRGLKRDKRRQVTGLIKSIKAGFSPRSNDQQPTQDPGAGRLGVHAELLLRDNLRNRTRIEKAYTHGIASAHEEIIIANAYFVPGVRLSRALVMAAQRGVKVRLLLQGRYEYFMQYYASRPVYLQLLQAGVEIHEYASSFLHAKVAVIDRKWVTVGSSNLDPLSMLLAREANLLIVDDDLASNLRETLLTAIENEGRAMTLQAFGQRSMLQRIKERVALGIMRLALLLQGKRY